MEDRPASSAPPLMMAFRKAFSARDSRKMDSAREGGEKIIRGRWSQDARRPDERELRDDLMKDLAALINTINFDAISPLGEFPNARKSILNYGAPSLARLGEDASSLEKIRQRLVQTLSAYEPRLRPGSIAVREAPDIDDRNQTVRLHVEADLISTPYDIPLEFVADIDVGAGKIHISSATAVR